jgi:hypothetical protein
MDHGGGDSPAQRHDRPGVHLGEQVVEGEDLRPVGVLGADGFVVQGGDRGLDLVRAEGSVPQGQFGRPYAGAQGSPSLDAVIGKS